MDPSVSYSDDKKKVLGGMTSLGHSDDIHNPFIPARNAGIQ
ncbi:hypothetical protein [Wolbachia endosymbiont of Ctenocephalides felis wCfeJ]|nr:hypothetical protein [Wolbachia endosymbiont of Ctenocephalides felis wCfeJ]